MNKIKKEWYRPSTLEGTKQTPYDNPDPEVNKTLDYIAQVTNTSKDKITEILKAYFLYSVEEIRKTYKPLS
jgi:hypothetical protein